MLVEGGPLFSAIYKAILMKPLWMNLGFLESYQLYRFYNVGRGIQFQMG